MIDTETTGLGEGREVVEVAVVGPSGELELHTRIRPERPPEPGAVRVHGLSSATLRSERPFPEIWPRLLPVLEDRTLIAYNAPFDRRSLDLTCARHGLARPRLTWACALARWEQRHGHRPSLRTACRLAGLSVPEGPHCAPQDAHMTWLLVHRLLS